MPRINIHEVDNTKPGSTGYQNFTVVVPGFHAPYFTEDTTDDVKADANGIILQKTILVKNESGDDVEQLVALTDEEVFGDEGVLEIKTQADFEQFIGLVKPEPITDGVSIDYIAKRIITVDENNDPIKIQYYNGSTYADYLANNQTYADLPMVIEQDTVLNTFTFITNGTTTGKVNSIFKYELTDTGLALYAEDPAKKGSYLDTATTDASITLNSSQEIEEASITVTIKVGEETKTETIEEKFEYSADVVLPAHYGNQIAYELLGLGYTVLYVNMGEFYPSKTKTETEVTTTKVPVLDEDGEPVLDEDDNPVMEDKTTTTTTEVNIGRNGVLESLKALGTEDFWANLRDKTTYDFRFVLTGFIDDNNGYIDFMKNASFEISKLVAWEKPGEDPLKHVRARGDALALIDLDESAIRATLASTTTGLGNTTKRTIQAIQAELGKQNFGSHGKYSAVFTPSVTYTNNTKADAFGNSQFPASFHYLACFAKSVFTNNNKEWFAVAGFNRGNSIYNISSTAFKLGDIAVQALEPRSEIKGSGVKVAVNVIVNNRGSYYIWGNRTAHDLGEELVASHFLNIRQLCITLKKFIYTLCRKFTFDPNSDVLWNNFTMSLTPLLEQMKNNQGIRGYAIEKVATSLKGVLAARIRIVPIEAVEDFEIEVALEDSLEGGTNATVSE